MTVWPAPSPEPADRFGETDDGLLPDLARLRQLSRAELIDLRDRVVAWRGSLVVEFRQRVAELLAEV